MRVHAVLFLLFVPLLFGYETEIHGATSRQSKVPVRGPSPSRVSKPPPVRIRDILKLGSSIALLGTEPISGSVLAAKTARDLLSRYNRHRRWKKSNHIRNYEASRGSHLVREGTLRGI